LIRIHRQSVSAYGNSTARLECEVEAFPDPLRYWERADGRLLENGDKYRITVIETGKYKVRFLISSRCRHGCLFVDTLARRVHDAISDCLQARMQLNITRINSHDYGRYHCISKNELGQTTGVFTVFGE
jgi:hypothetical protein